MGCVGSSKWGIMNDSCFELQDLSFTEIEKAEGRAGSAGWMG